MSELKNRGVVRITDMDLLKQEVEMWREEWRVRVMECSRAKLAARLARERYTKALNALKKLKGQNEQQ